MKLGEKQELENRIKELKEENKNLGCVGRSKR